MQISRKWISDDTNCSVLCRCESFSWDLKREQELKLKQEGLPLVLRVRGLRTKMQWGVAKPVLGCSRVPVTPLLQSCLATVAWVSVLPFSSQASGPGAAVPPGGWGRKRKK